jgi:two-component sensor histidine kinase
MKPHGFIAPDDSLVLVEELTHRVIHEFTHAIMSIDEAATRISEPRARAVLVDAMRILRAYAAAHRALQAPHTPGQTDLSEYLAGICAAQTQAQLNELGVRLALKRADVRLDAGRCWRVGLIVAELINNAVRHGFGGGAGEIAIELAVDGSSVLCRVTDNGRAAGQAPPARGRFLVEALAAELGGDAQWRFTPLGTTVLLIVPRDAASSCDGRASVQSQASRPRPAAEALPRL